MMITSEERLISTRMRLQLQTQMGICTIHSICRDQRGSAVGRRALLLKMGVGLVEERTVRIPVNLESL